MAVAEAGVKDGVPHPEGSRGGAIEATCERVGGNAFKASAAPPGVVGWQAGWQAYKQSSTRAEGKSSLTTECSN